MKARICTSDIAPLTRFVFTLRLEQRATRNSLSWLRLTSLTRWWAHICSLRQLGKPLATKWNFTFMTIHLCHCLYRFVVEFASGLLSLTLWIQENYLRTDPSRTRNLVGPDQTLKHLELMDKAASSISDGDLVDALIHGFVFLQNTVLTTNILRRLDLNNIGVSCRCTPFALLSARRLFSTGLAVVGEVRIKWRPLSAFRSTTSRHVIPD